ncbi:chitin deacetylase [Chytriomyces hyalinus]|nr:chitin deacetylase [Chytriomyces hyalinus]
MSSDSARSRNMAVHHKPDHFIRPNARPGPSHGDPASPEAPLVNVANFTWVNGFDLYDTAPGVPAWTEYFATASLGPTGQLVVPKEVERCTIKGNKVWGASFDDGPSEFTHYVQDYFKSKGLLTTFFVVGSQIAMFPSVLQDSYNAGHGIGIHTWSHAKLTTLSDDQVISELVFGAKAIADTLGIYPKYFRPPYGESDGRVLRLAASLGLTSVVWTADSNDSDDAVDISETLTNEVVPANFETFVSEGRDKDISLEHDRWEYEAKIASTAMDILLTGGYNIMPIHQCLEDANPYENKILEGFFKSGQFENKETVMSPYMAAATTTAVVTGNAGVNNVATTTGKQSAAAPGGFLAVLSSLGAFMALVLSV